MGWGFSAINKYFLVFFIFMLVGGVVTQTTDSSANSETSPWLANESPVLSNLKEDIPFDQVPQHTDGGQECVIQQKFITRPAKKLPPQSELSYLSCGVDTAFGTIDKTAKLTRLGTNVSGDVYLPNGTKNKLLPVPNSNVAIYMDNSAPSGSYLTLEKDIQQRLSSEPNSITGEVKHSVRTGLSHSLKNESGSPLYARMDTVAFSGNGQWAVFDAVGIGITRLNINSGEILILAPGYKYDSGQDPSLQMAISSDGRYVAVSSFTFSMFKIYDLNTCIKSLVPDKPATCMARDLKTILRSNMSDHLGVGTKMSFTDDYNLKFYGTTLKNNVRARYIHLLTAYGQAPTEFSYLALGDSFASGEGARNYKLGTDVKSPNNKCHVSMNSYSYLIGQELALNKYESIACSGAKIKDINSQYIDDYNRSENGRQALGLENNENTDNIIRNFLPGYRIQKQFVAEYKPNKITISISGNDMGFGTIIKNCTFWFSPSICYSQPSERAALVKKINDRFGELTTVYKQLKDSSPGVDVYAIGYPKMVNPDGPCDVNVRASKEELIFFNDLVDYINFVIKKSADSAGVYYVDVSNALEGKRLCEPFLTELAVNGLTLGNDKFFDIGPIGNESYHPNEIGHILLKEAILEKTNNFTAENPFPVMVAEPKMSDARDFIKTDAYDLLDTNFIDKSDMVDSWWYKNESKLLSQGDFAPNSAVSVSLTSDPISLGNFPANNDGTVNASLTLPDTVPIGYHTLHVVGKNIAGENVEYQQLLFIGDSEGDSDGDGVPDEQDPCIAIEPSGMDYDKDGIDDACDGQIGEPLVDEPEIIDTNPVTNPLPDFESQPDDSNGAGIIDEVNSGQNQNSSNTALGQGQTSSGLQSSGSSGASSQSSSLQSTGVVFSGGNNVGLSLNQSGPTKVLSSSAKDPAPVKTSSGDSSGLVYPILGVLIVLTIVVWFLRRRTIADN